MYKNAASSDWLRISTRMQCCQVKKKKEAKFQRKCPFVRLVRNFGRNTTSAFLHQNIQIEYFLVQEEKAKFFPKKNSENFLLKLPLVPTGQEFWPECNFVVLALKPAYSIFSGPKRKRKILSKKKKIQGNVVRKYS